MGGYGPLPSLKDLKYTALFGRWLKMTVIRIPNSGPVLGSIGSTLESWSSERLQMADVLGDRGGIPSVDDMNPACLHIPTL